MFIRKKQYNQLIQHVKRLEEGLSFLQEQYLKFLEQSIPLVERLEHISASLNRPIFYARERGDAFDPYHEPTLQTCPSCNEQVEQLFLCTDRRLSKGERVQLEPGEMLACEQCLSTNTRN